MQARGHVVRGSAAGPRELGAHFSAERPLGSSAGHSGDAPAPPAVLPWRCAPTPEAVGWRDEGTFSSMQPGSKLLAWTNLFSSLCFP